MGDRRLCHTSGVDEHTYRLPTPSGRVIRTAVRPLDMAVGTIHGQPMALGGVAKKAFSIDEDQFRSSYMSMYHVHVHVDPFTFTPFRVRVKKGLQVTKGCFFRCTTCATTFAQTTYTRAVSSMAARARSGWAEAPLSGGIGHLAGTETTESDARVK